MDNPIVEAFLTGTLRSSTPDSGVLSLLDALIEEEEEKKVKYFNPITKEERRMNQFNQGFNAAKSDTIATLKAAKEEITNLEK